MDCPNGQSKDKPTSKKVERSKGRRAYIFWEENEVSSQATLQQKVKKLICVS